MPLKSLIVLALVHTLVAFDIHDSFLHHKNRKEFVDVPNPCESFSSSDKWITIQRRLDGTVDFYRTWEEYRNGFGSLYGEMWIGLDNLHYLTTQRATKLLVVMEDLQGKFACAAYKSFQIESPSNKFRLSVAGYTGDAGDSLSYHNLSSFSTHDSDNDNHGSNCAQVYKGAWWYKACHHSNLNGQYLNGSHTAFATGVNWKEWKGYYYSLKSVEMMVAPSD